MLSAPQIRQQFIDFFIERASHKIVPSSPVVPHDDPTLLFTNAGMNQFKPLFLGNVEPGSPLAGLTRAVNSQKCIRAGGKHNDLDDVGADTYHHTFFEMLGNWSFGDYFKAEAIQWAWELLTEVWHIDPSRLYATYFQGDKELDLDPDREAYELWLKYLPADRVLPGNTKDNFWEMGDTGPCGPCSELHYDGRVDALRQKTPGYQLVNADSPDVIEIWNLVFIQFNRTEKGLSPLPAKHVDTGMGFERIVRVIQGQSSNYDTDVFTPLFEAIRTVCKCEPYSAEMTSPRDIAYRVVADHLRALSFAIADGAVPSNEGRGYVLRRILRRAVRMARQNLGIERPFLGLLVPVLAEQVSDVFPEVQKNADKIIGVLTEEEESFGRTLSQGMALFDKAVEHAGDTKRVTAEDAFKLHDTYGFPIDLTRVMAEERGLTVDEAGFTKLMEEARELSRSGGKDDPTARLALSTDEIATLERLNIRATDDSDKYHGRNIRTTVKAIWNGYDFDEDLIAANTRPTDRFTLILSHTNLYATSGGQQADRGLATVIKPTSANKLRHGEFVVEDVRKCGPYIAHIGRIAKGEVNVGDELELHLDHHKRDACAANHTATHLLNHALRAVLGEHIEQKGSLVAPDRLRFDFSHDKPIGADEVRRIEQRVNGAIEADLKVHAELASLNDARSINGLRAVFGEVYPDPVRIVSVGVAVPTLVSDPDNETWHDYAIEFCGGTHLDTTGEATIFTIVSEEAVSKGVRRMTAITGQAASDAIQRAADLHGRIEDALSLEGDQLDAVCKALAGEVESGDIPLVRRLELRESIAKLQARLKDARKADAAAGRGAAVDAARKLASSTPPDQRTIVGMIPAGSDRQALLAAVDALQGNRPNAAILVFSVDEPESKVTIVAKVPDDLIQAGLKAGDWVRTAAQACGGKGGGRPDSAQGGGTDPSAVAHAAAQAREFASRALS